MKKILIALDYDPSAERIAETGYAFAKAMQAKVTLLHVVADATYYSDMAYSPIMGFTGFIYPGIDEMLVKDLLENSHKFLNTSKAHLGDDSIETIVKEGDFVDVILEEVKNESYDLVVVGTHTRRGLDKLVNENFAEKILEKIQIPMLVIPNKED